MRYVFAFLILAVLSFPAANASEADALAEAGASFVAMGKVEKAKDILYRALANDENCPLATYELGKLFQAEGDTVSAVNFFSKTINLMQNANKPEYASKISDAKARLQTLNPYSGNFTHVFEEYSRELTQTCASYNDSVTCAEALNRVQVLNMADYLPADKMPNIPKPSQPTTGKTSMKVSTAAVPVPLEIERALKAAGWTTITGTWKKKSEGVLRGHRRKTLEAPKINGGIKLLVDQGGSGSVLGFRPQRAERSVQRSQRFCLQQRAGINDDGNRIRLHDRQRPELQGFRSTKLGDEHRCLFVPRTLDQPGEPAQARRDDHRQGIRAAHPG